MRQRYIFSDNNQIMNLLILIFLLSSQANNKKFRTMSKYKRIAIKGREYVYDIRRKIADNRHKEGFPKVEDYNITDDIVDDYLYELMGGPQSIEEQKRLYTRYGLCFIIPIAIVALMKQTMINLLIGVGSGFVLCCFYFFFHTALRMRRLRKMAKSGVMEYVEAVENFEN